MSSFSRAKHNDIATKTRKQCSYSVLSDFSSQKYGLLLKTFHGTYEKRFYSRILIQHPQWVTKLITRKTCVDHL